MAKKVTNKLSPIAFMFGAFTGGYFHGRYLKKTHTMKMEEYCKELNVLKDEVKYVKENIINKYKHTDRCKQLEKLWSEHRISRESVSLDKESYTSTESSLESTTLGESSRHDSADHSSS